ncbi:SGNH/GDSL hydrolase family protein [Microlunatus panaciterrae]|uniref:SGNH/GDSL hydrolase family protein n=1 Tax=Microlunatus panaciterrae TaxID=400768 RepID=UPI00308468C7
MLLAAVLVTSVSCDGPAGRSAPAPSDSPSATLSRPAIAWTAVALGDSVTSGYGCGCSAFPDQYAHAASARYDVPITMHNLGQGGLTSGQLLSRLSDSESAESQLVSSADIDLITIGANDFADQHEAITQGACLGAGVKVCTEDELRQLSSNVADIIATIRQRRQGLPTAILITGYWNVFEDGDVARASFPKAGLRASKDLTAVVNLAIQSAASAAGIDYVDLSGPFTRQTPSSDVTTLLAPDGDHPNAAGHALIARTLLSEGLPGLA